MAGVSVPVVHRKDGTQGIAYDVSSVESERRVCARASRDDEQARRVRVPCRRESQGAVGGVWRRKRRGDAGTGDVCGCFAKST